MKHITYPIGALLAMSLAPTLYAQNGDAKAGAQVYYDYGCYGCHGYGGYGRKDLNDTGSAILVNEEVFRAFLRGRADVAPLLPVTDMPNYPANSLSDEQVRDLYAYIRSMPPNLPETGGVETFRQILEIAEQPYRND
jgi:Cytochrome c553